MSTRLCTPLSMLAEWNRRSNGDLVRLGSNMVLEPVVPTRSSNDGDSAGFIRFYQ